MKGPPDPAGGGRHHSKLTAPEAGLSAALRELGLSAHNVVGVGDAENDHAFLTLYEISCAVANARPLVKERADFVSEHDHGDGVIDVCDRLLARDLDDTARAVTRLQLSLDNDQQVTLRTHGESALVAGSSGSGKSTIAHALREQLHERGYQYCVIDPEGDYDALEGFVVSGSADHPPDLDHVTQGLAKTAQQGVVNLLGVPVADRLDSLSVWAHQDVGAPARRP